MPTTQPMDILVMKMPAWKKGISFAIGSGIVVIGVAVMSHTYTKPDHLLLIGGSIMTVLGVINLLLEFGFTTTLVADAQGITVRESAMTSTRHVSWNEVRAFEKATTANKPVGARGVLILQPILSFLSITLVSPDGGPSNQRTVTIPELRLPGTVEEAIAQLEAFRASIVTAHKNI